ncbi:MAG: CBS domain-containing protein [Anaerolineales bacterium]|jgi:acetoin utilization protein AcuB
MLVQEFMSKKPVTIPPDMSVSDALQLMREKKVHRLPVLNAHGKLVGIVAEGDLLYASPSPATSLNVWEIHSLLAKLKVDKVMTRKVITVSEDTPIEEAARIMAENKIGGLPVIRGTALAGIITESDLFKIFTSLLGGRRHGVRLSATISGSKGTFAKITRAIAEAGGDIVGLGFNEVSMEPEVWEMTVKVQELSRTKLINILTPVVKSVLDVREM